MAAEVTISVYHASMCSYGIEIMPVSTAFSVAAKVCLAGCGRHPATICDARETRRTEPDTIIGPHKLARRCYPARADLPWFIEMAAAAAGEFFLILANPQPINVLY